MKLSKLIENYKNKADSFTLEELSDKWKCSFFLIPKFNNGRRKKTAYYKILETDVPVQYVRAETVPKKRYFYALSFKKSSLKYINIYSKKKIKHATSLYKRKK